MNMLECARQNKIIAIVRGLRPDLILQLGQALCDGGIRMMEVTYNQSRPESWADTANAIAAAANEFADRMIIGAGTVISCDQVDMTLRANGSFIVTPVVQPDIIRHAKAQGLGAFPGAMTPTEILAAYEAGADAVKVFPAGSLGAEYIRAIRAPLSHIPLLAVGGVNENNAAEYIRAGCIGLGIGGNLVNRAWIEAGEWGKITELARALIAAVSAAE